MIKNLLFDLGGVIMDIRRSNCIDAFKKLGMAHPEQFLGEYVQAGPFQGIENGSMSPQQFHDALRPFLGDDITDRQIDEAFMKFLIGIPSHRLSTLRRLRQNYNIYLLSNTNPIMWNAMIADEFNRDDRGGINAYFDGVVTSFEAKSMKPDSRIFEYACRKLNITPSETLFIDDSQSNLDTAAALGFDTLLVEPGNEFAELLRSKNISLS